jgi:DNA-binding NtrC family response regulator
MRVLQERCLQRLGGKETIPVNVRVIAATHRDLETAIRGKQFREDLYYRLSVVEITLPPLRDRREDIPELVRFFLRKHAGELGVKDPSISDDAVEYLRSQPWAGNVRELENVVRKVLLLAQGYTINLDHVRAAAMRTVAKVNAGEQSLRQQVDELLAAAQRGELSDACARLLLAAEKELYSRAIELAQGNQARAARWAGVSRLTMREKLRHFGLHPATENPEAQTQD